MNPLLGELAQALEDSIDAKMLYRERQVAKRAGEATQDEVNELLDLYEHFVRYGNYLWLKGRAAVAQAELHAEPNEHIDQLRERLARLLGKGQGA